MCGGRNWGLEEAIVVCRQLGYPHATQFYRWVDTCEGSFAALAGYAMNGCTKQG